VSKAFTKDDDDAGFEVPPSVARHAALLTPIGADCMHEEIRKLAADPSVVSDAKRERLEALVTNAPILEKPADEEVASLGSRVWIRNEKGVARTVVIVTPEEVGHVPDGASATSPLARALVGARAGDEVTVELAGREEEVTIERVAWASAPAR